MEDEFAGKSFREALEIIIANPKDERYTTRQINKLAELHQLAIDKAVAESEVYAKEGK